MIDLEILRKDPERVKKNLKERGIKLDIDRLQELEGKVAQLNGDIDDMRALRNKNAELMQHINGLSAEARQSAILKGKELKEQLAKQEAVLKELQQLRMELLLALPNFALPGVPSGQSDKENIVIKKEGLPTSLPFTPRNHVEIMEGQGWLDFERGSKVTGAKFYFVLGDAALLDLALQRFAFDVVAAHGFTPVITPDLAKDEIIEGIGFSPRGPEAQIYSIEDQPLSLVGTAEITMGGFHAKEFFPTHELPKRYVALSHCFRTEAGAYGSYSHGLYRVHQFTKVEMFIFSTPEQSENEHKLLLSIEEEILQKMQLPYRVVEMCMGDLGGPAARKYDLEAWMPGRGDYGEVTSTSNCTDYQARRLGIRYTNDKGSFFVHTLNGTALTTSRFPIAIIENYQQADGTVRVPDVLQPYLGGEKVLGKRLS